MPPKKKEKQKEECPTTLGKSYETRSTSQRATSSVSEMRDDMEIMAPGTATTSAASSSTDLIIPNNLSEDVKRWKRADVQAFLNANKEKYDLDDKHIKVVQIQEVAGVDFLKLTKEDLMQYGLKGGPATRIVELVEKLKENKGLVERAVPAKRSYEESTGRDNLVVISKERLSEFDQQWNEHKINLLRSPPASGKSTFAKWFGLYSKNKGRVVRRISMTLVNSITDAMQNKNIFNAAWKKHVGETWTNCLDSTMPTDILIDEAQILYGKADFFWNNIKGLQDSPKHNLRVMLLSMYSDRPGVPGNGEDDRYTPIEFEYALGMEQLRLTRTEFDELVDRFIKFIYDNEDFHLTIPGEVRDKIFNATLGHPHLVRTTLSGLKDRCRRGYSSEDDMGLYLVSGGYFFAIEQTRVFDWLTNLEITNDDANFLRDVYYSVDSDSTFIVDPRNKQLYQTAKRFRRSGLITEAIGRRYQFAAPIVRIMLGSRLFKARTSLTRSTEDFDNFLLLSIERMRPSTLFNSLSRSSSEGAYLLERQWQTEWLLAATTAAPLGSSISPDVGAVYGTRAYLDFYIDGGLNWGVELMREGIRMENHVSRFTRTGTYRLIPFTRWAIIDFRRDSLVPETLESNVWYAMYANDYETVTIMRQGHEDVVLTLSGDNLLSPFQSP